MLTRTTKEKLLRRRRQRGIVMLEGIIVATLLMICMASGVFLHRVYVQKFRVMRDARAVAWTAALDGCQERTDFAAIVSRVFRGARPSDPKDFVIRTALGTSSSTRDASTTAPKQLGGGTFQQRSYVIVACNEAVQSTHGDLLDLAGYFLDNLLPF